MLGELKALSAGRIYMQDILKTKCLFDTNILIYLYDRESSFHNKAKEIFLKIAEEEKDIFIAQQNIIEFFNVATKDFHNIPSSVKIDIEDIIKDFHVIIPHSSTLALFMELVIEVNGKQDIFDYYLAATMLDNGIHTIITANEKDFKNIKGISVYNPFK